MKIKKVIPSGYCKGVVGAINIAKKTKEQYPNEKITVLGMIVHNKYITEALRQIGVETLDDSNKTKEELIEEVNEGVVIFTAHGIADHIKARAKEKGLILVDASCSDVVKTQNIVKDKLAEGYEILYIGKKNHPEAVAVLAISEHIHLVSKVSDLESLSDYPKVFVTNQTTMSIFETRFIFDKILEKYPNAVILEEICKATSSRQEAIIKLEDCDLLYIVGDPKSNNSNKLREIGLQNGVKKAFLIESANDIKEEDLKDAQNVYVTAGASTPTYLTNQVIEVLNDYNETHILKKPSIDISHII